MEHIFAPGGEGFLAYGGGSLTYGEGSFTYWDAGKYLVGRNDHLKPMSFFWLIWNLLARIVISICNLSSLLSLSSFSSLSGWFNTVPNMELGQNFYVRLILLGTMYARMHTHTPLEPLWSFEQFLQQYTVVVKYTAGQRKKNLQDHTTLPLLSSYVPGDSFRVRYAPSPKLIFTAGIFVSSFF